MATETKNKSAVSTLKDSNSKTQHLTVAPTSPLYAIPSPTHSPPPWKYKDEFMPPYPGSPSARNHTHNYQACGANASPNSDDYVYDEDLDDDTSLDTETDEDDELEPEMRCDKPPSPPPTSPADVYRTVTLVHCPNQFERPAPYGISAYTAHFLDNSGPFNSPGSKRGRYASGNVHHGFFSLAINSPFIKRDPSPPPRLIPHPPSQPCPRENKSSRGRVNRFIHRPQSPIPPQVSPSPPPPPPPPPPLPSSCKRAPNIVRHPATPSRKNRPPTPMATTKTLAPGNYRGYRKPSLSLQDPKLSKSEGVTLPPINTGLQNSTSSDITSSEFPINHNVSSFSRYSFTQNNATPSSGAQAREQYSNRLFQRKHNASLLSRPKQAPPPTPPPYHYSGARKNRAEQFNWEDHSIYAKTPCGTRPTSQLRKAPTRPRSTRDDPLLASLKETNDDSSKQ